MKYDRFVFFGCSFTYSQDCASDLSLVDTNGKIIGYPKGASPTSKYTDDENSYPTLVGNHFGVEIENHGVVKNTNELMSHQIYNWVYENRKQVDFNRTLIIVNATSSYRTSTTQFPGLYPQIKLPFTSNHFPILLSRPEYFDSKASEKIPKFIRNEARAHINFMSQEAEDFLPMRSLYVLMGLRDFCRHHGLDIVIFDMLFRHHYYRNLRTWYDPLLFDHIFENHSSLYKSIREYGIRDYQNDSGYINAHSEHFTKAGYRLIAEEVCQTLEPKISGHSS